MSLSPAVIDALVAAGATVEMLAAAVKADMAEADARLADKRAKDAERQRKSRAGRAVSHDVTVTSCDNADVTDDPLSRPPNEKNSNPPTHTPENNTARVKGHRLPDDWQPKPLTGDAALAAARWPPGAIERELARFRDWAASATGPNSRKSNWDAAWRNWIRKTEDDGRYRANGQPKQSAQRGGSTRDAAQLALSRMGYG